MKDYLDVRRALGFKLKNQAIWLREFVEFMERHRAHRITRKWALNWAEKNTTGSAGCRAEKYHCICDFARFRSNADPNTEVPPADLMPLHRSRNRFYLYSNDEIRSVLAETLRRRRGASSLSKWVRYTLYGLLSVTGLRLGEALSLNLGDVDIENGILTVRNSKFGSSRLVPVHSSTCTALKKYLERRNEYFEGRSVTPFFASRNGKRLTNCEAYSSFVRISQKVGLRKPGDKHGPRLHDFRHTAATRALVQCYRSKDGPEHRLPVLATYLGHTNLRYTYWYLHQNPSIMKEAIARLERQWKNVP
jgi:integrase